MRTHATDTTAYTHNPGTGADAVITVAADEKHGWVIDEMDASYDDPSTAVGPLIVTFGGVVVWKRQLAALGNMGQFSFKSGLGNGKKNEALVITLKGLSGVTGSLNANIR